MSSRQTRQRSRNESSDDVEAVEASQRQRQQFHREENNNDRNVASHAPAAAAAAASSTSSSAIPIQAKTPFVPYTDIIHSILPFLSLKSLASTHRLNREWKEAIESFQPLCGAKFEPQPPKETWFHEFEYQFELDSHALAKIRQHPNSPLLRHITTVHVYCPAEIVGDELSNLFPSLTVLKLEKPECEGEAVIKDVGIIKTCKNLTHLRVEFADPDYYENSDLGTFSTDQATSTLANVISKHESLTTVSIYGSQIGTLSFRHLADAAICEKVTSLELEENLFRMEDVTSHFAHAVKQNKMLTDIHLDYSDFTVQSVAAITNALKHHEGVTKLTLGTIQYVRDNDEARLDACMNAFIKQNNNITYLTLRTMGFSNAAPLINALKHNTSLTSVNLKENDFDAAAASLFADLVNENKRITVDLRENPITKEEALLIAARVDGGVHVGDYRNMIVGDNRPIRLYLPGTDQVDSDAFKHKIQRMQAALTAVNGVFKNSKPEDVDGDLQKALFGSAKNAENES